MKLTSRFVRLHRQLKYLAGSRSISTHSLCEALESRLLLSTGAVEVWAGDTVPTSLYSPDQSGYTQLGSTNTPNAPFVVFTGGVQYTYFEIVTRGQVQVDSVQLSDATYLTSVQSTGSTSDGGTNMIGAPDGNFTTIGTSVNEQGTFAGYAEITNQHSWTSLNIQIGSMAVMLQGQVELERDYLPGAANPYDYDSTLELDDNSLITSAEVRNPSGVWYPLTLDTGDNNPDAQWTFENNYSSSASLTAAVPNGVYTFEAQSPFGTTTTQFSYTMPTLTPVIAPIGLTDGITGISTSPTFHWNAIGDSNPNDNLEVEIDGPNNEDTLIDQQLANTSVTSFSPASPLIASSNYDLELRLQSFSQTTNGDGFTLNTEIDNETDLVFRTAGSAASAPGLYLTSVGFPVGTIYPGSWFKLPVTGGDSGGSAIGKSGGVVVPIQYEAVLAASKTWGAAGNIIIGQGTIGDGSGGGQVGGDTFSDDDLNVQIPASTAPGTYYVGIKGDSTGVISGNTTAWSSTKITITANGTIGITPPATQSVTVGQSKSFAIGSFTQAAATAPYAADVSWGDGSADSIYAVTSTGTIPAAAHTYATPGVKTVTVTVTDWDGEATKTSTFSANVLLPVTTTTVAGSTLNPTVEGNSVTLQATVSPNTGNGNTATGLVTFMDGGTTLGTGALNGSGVASYVTSALTVGTHPITAVYAGDGNFSGSTSTVVFNQFITLTHSQNQAYVSQMYENVLGRAADPTGLANWTEELDTGTPLEQVALGLSSSLEYYNKLVTSYYETYLNRAPDTNGLNYWANQMTLGVSGPSILVGIVSSQEYINDGGDTAVGYITELYEAFLNRAPDPGGLSNWEATYSASGPVPVASGFVYALETYDDIITGYYQTDLKRAPTAGELTTWTNDLIAGVSEQQVIADILALPEYLTANNIT